MAITVSANGTFRGQSNEREYQQQHSEAKQAQVTDLIEKPESTHQQQLKKKAQLKSFVFLMACIFERKTIVLRIFGRFDFCCWRQFYATHIYIRWYVDFLINPDAEQKKTFSTWYCTQYHIHFEFMTTDVCTHTHTHTHTLSQPLQMRLNRRKINGIA